MADRIVLYVVGGRVVVVAAVAGRSAVVIIAPIGVESVYLSVCLSVCLSVFLAIDTERHGEMLPERVVVELIVR